MTKECINNFSAGRSFLSQQKYDKSRVDNRQYVYYTPYSNKLIAIYTSVYIMLNNR